MTNRIEMWIPIEPRGQSRARHMVTKSGIGITYKDKAQKLDETKLAAHIVRAAAGKRLTGPIRMSVVAFFGIPASFSKTKRMSALSGALLPEKKPDIDNIIKHVLDVSQGLIFDDDKSVCHISATKCYGGEPGYEIVFEGINK